MNPIHSSMLYHISSLTLIALVLSSCARPTIRSVEERMLVLDAGLRHGILTKDDYAIGLKNLAGANLPQTSKKSQTKEQIEKMATADAKTLGKVAELNKKYNAGVLSRPALDLLVAQERQNQALSKRLKALDRANFAAGLSAGLAAMNQSQPTLYRNPFSPTAPPPHIAPTIVNPTLPGTNIRDYSRSGARIEGDNIYPTLPGTSYRDYSKPGYRIEQR